MNILKCKHCNSENIIKNGFRINIKTNESVRRIFCKDCKKYCSSSYNERYSDDLKEKVIQCHNSRMSSSNIAKVFNIAPNERSEAF